MVDLIVDKIPVLTHKEAKMLTKIYFLMAANEKEDQIKVSGTIKPLIEAI